MRKDFYTKIITVVAILLAIIGTANFIELPTIAAESKISIQGEKYTFDDSTDYIFENSIDSSATNENNTYGNLMISGDTSGVSNVDGFATYKVNDGFVTISYAIDQSKLNEVEEEWHLYSDSTDEVDTIHLENDVSKGAIILQASIDGQKWITETYKTDIFSDVASTIDFYTTSDIQQLNGCYYRIIVAYELEKKTGESWFFNMDEHAYERHAEEYKFYLVNSETNSALATTPDDTPKMNLGTKINTGKGNGYSGHEAIDTDDPHYGWDIGQFYVNGYTRSVTDSETGSTVFLKNVGDTVTLWFNLQQDIDCLNGNEDLHIYEDAGGYDQYFEVGKTYFKHGTLIIRYSNFQNEKSDPIIYTDYLAANAKTGANTRVQLFEEGNYEVALDYEIVNESGVDSYTDYRIFFTFEIRNGNCMVYPLEVGTGAELADCANTENGFQLDMARSRYLNIDVRRVVVSSGSDGLISEDIRFNRPAKDGDTYTDEGIYTFSVKNKYTGEMTEKNIYVGNNKYLLALSKNKISVSELNDFIKNEYVVETDGSLIAPSVENDASEEFDDIALESDIVNMIEEGKDDVVSQNISEVEETESEADIISVEEYYATEGPEGRKAAKDRENNLLVMVFLALGILLIGGVIVLVHKKRSRVIDNISNINSESDKADDEKNEND